MMCFAINTRSWSTHRSSANCLCKFCMIPEMATPGLITAASPKRFCSSRSLRSSAKDLAFSCSPQYPRNRARRLVRAAATAAPAAITPVSHDAERAPAAREHVEAIRSLNGWVEENLLPLLIPVEASWQPQDMLPCAAQKAAFLESVAELQARAAGVPDDILVCLVGNMVTEEALPTYQTMFNRVEGMRDETGCSEQPWARWVRGWTAEENRHGDLLQTYLYLSGRVDMHQVAKTVHYLLRNGMEMHSSNSPYHGILYGSFQERATFISHSNTARRVNEHGDQCLAKICGAIAGDEKRHEMAYTKVCGKLFELDPDGIMQTFADILRCRIRMPGRHMSDGRDGDLFAHFCAVEQRAGVYTMRDYGEVVEHFVTKWKVPELTGLSGEGRHAQEYVCRLPQKIRMMEERAHELSARNEPTLVSFSWVFDRPVIMH